MQPAPLSHSGRARRRADSGFTILEVAMSAFIMAFGIATSIVAMQTGFKSIDLARGTTMASQLMQSEMERVRMLSWTAVMALPEKEEVDLSTYFSSNPEIINKYQVVRVVEIEAARPDDVREITIYVIWSGYDGRRHQRSFKSMYAKNGLYDYYYTLARP